MLNIDYSDLISDFDYYCDQAVLKNETIIVARDNKEDIVIMSQEKYNEYEKYKNNNDE